MALDTSEVVVAAGSAVAAAPAGTAEPLFATDPIAAPWVDLGYIDEDGVTYTDSPEEETIPAWQSPDPILVLLSTVTRTWAFNFMQWNPDTLAFVIGGAPVTPPATPPAWEPAKGGRQEWALVFRWNWNQYKAQIWAPRGKVTGDVETQLVRTDTANFSATFTATPSGAEPAWRFSSDHPAFAGGVTLEAREPESSGKKAKAAA
jgi:hypothetical protein